MRKYSPSIKHPRRSPGNSSGKGTDECRCCYRNDTTIWQSRVVVWLLIGLAFVLSLAALSELRVIGEDRGASHVSAGLALFYFAFVAVCCIAVVCLCRVIPVLIHRCQTRLFIRLLRPIGTRLVVFEARQLRDVAELSVPHEYGYTPTMHRLIIHSRWLPILLDERANVLQLATIRELLRNS